MEIEPPPEILLSTQKPSEIQVVLHPLVILGISDYVTRHTLRNQPGPVVGALLGQQDGREITIEHAFDVKTSTRSGLNHGEFVLDEAWFAQRLEQMKQVHTDRQLDLVGWFTLMPRSGPRSNLLAIHRQITELYNESAILLGFHPADVQGHSVGGRLPLTIYESNYEAVDTQGAAEDDGEDKAMDLGGPSSSGDARMKLMFRELSYSVETGEAEMISMDSVARGGGNATAFKSSEKKTSSPVAVEATTPGKRRIVSQKEGESSRIAEKAPTQVTLSREEEETVAALTAKANAIKMLQARIKLLINYLDKLPPDLVAGNKTAGDESMADADATTPSNTILRQIKALVSRLDLMAPAASDEELKEEKLREENDVNVISLLNDIMQGVNEAWGVGKKFNIVDNMKGAASKHQQQQGPQFIGGQAGDLAMGLAV